jgi:hypothetical protein
MSPSSYHCSTPQYNKNPKDRIRTCAQTNLYNKGIETSFSLRQRFEFFVETKDIEPSTQWLQTTIARALVHAPPFEVRLFTETGISPQTVVGAAEFESAR